jgi:hypothetical protein
MQNQLSQSPTGGGAIARLNRAINQIDNAERLLLSLPGNYWKHDRELITRITNDLHQISLKIQNDLIKQ